MPGIPPAATTPLLFSSLGNISLRLGDKDAAKRWGGAVLPQRSGNPVRELQVALTAVGTYTAALDGDFGQGTQLAVRRFQWFVLNSRHRLQVLPGTAPSAGTIVEYVQNAMVQLTGQCNATLASELLAWLQGNFRTTTLLVRVPVARFASTSRSATFSTLGYPNAADSEILVHQGFVEGLDTLDATATDKGVTLRLNQTFRLQNVPPTGAVVPPATRSQHLIGRAVDLNIVDGQTVVTSAMFIGNTATQNAKDHVKAVKDAGLRWGGDFNPKDPPHFDDPVLASTEAYDMNFFFCQRFFSLQHPIRLLV